MILQIPADALAVLGDSTSGLGAEAANAVAANPATLVTGIVLIAAAIILFLFIKKIIVNSILGFVGWIIFIVVIGVEQSLLLPSLAVSVIFGLAGLGVLLVLKFFGVI